MVVCVLTNFLNHEGNKTIINVDVASNLHNLGDVLVVDPQSFLVTILHELVVQGELDHFSLLELNLLSAALNKSRKGKHVSSLVENCCMKPHDYMQ